MTEPERARGLRQLVDEWNERARRMASEEGVPAAAVMVLSMCASELEALLPALEPTP